jgi:hypothetical protein
MPVSPDELIKLFIQARDDHRARQKAAKRRQQLKENPSWFKP